MTLLEKWDMAKVCIFNPHNMRPTESMGKHIRDCLETKYIERLIHFKDCWIMYSVENYYDVINLYTGKIMPTKMMDGVKVYKLPLTIDVDGKERLCYVGEEYYGCVPFSRMNEEVRIGSVPQWID